MTDMTPTYFSISLAHSSSTTSLGKKTDNSYLQIFPNPANSSFSLSWKGAARSVKVRNVLGIETLSKLVGSDNLSCSLSISGLASGAYQINIIFLDGHEENGNVVIQK